MKYSILKHVVTAAVILATAFMVVDGKRGLIRGDRDEMRLSAFEASENTNLNEIYFRTSKSMKKIKSKRGPKSGRKSNKESKGKMGLKSKIKKSKSKRRFKSLSKKSKRKNKMRPRSEFGEKLKKEIDNGTKRVKDMFGFGLKSKKSKKSPSMKSKSKKSPSKKSNFGKLPPSKNSKSKEDVSKTRSRSKSESYSMSKDASISNDIDLGSTSASAAAASSENSSSDQLTPPVSMPAFLENTSNSKDSNENTMDASETDSEDNIDFEIEFERVGDMDRFAEGVEENFGA